MLAAPQIVWASEKDSNETAGTTTTSKKVVFQLAAAKKPVAKPIAYPKPKPAGHSAKPLPKPTAPKPKPVHVSPPAPKPTTPAPITPPVTAAPAPVTEPTPAPAPLDPAAIKEKILSSGVPAASLERILNFIAKNAGQEIDQNIYICRDAHGNWDENGVAPCGPGDQEPYVRKLQIKKPRYVASVDFSLPSTAERFFFIDLETGDVQRFLSVHGKGSGAGKWAYKFSNLMNSNQSSLGLYAIGGVYVGDKGQTMRLYGLESSNDQAFKRDIVLHGAWYARKDFLSNIDPATKQPIDRLGLSWGCPAVAPETQSKILPLLRDGGLIDLYQPQLMDLALTGLEVTIPEPAK